MAKKETLLDRFSDLTWSDIEEWAGEKIVSRGKSYQFRGRVFDLAVTADGSLIAWVDGSKRYAARVTMNKHGLPDSICTCPYELNCKHGVAVVIEYLKQIENNQYVPKAKNDDPRLKLLEDEERDDETYDDEIPIHEDMQNIEEFLNGKTKNQLIDLIHELAEQYPKIVENLSDRQQLISGNTKTLVTRLRREIHDIGDEPGWQNYWQGEGFTPDYSEIRQKLETLLKAGYADEVLTLGHELITTGIRQVKESQDEGETAMEIDFCMPVIVRALAQSSLDTADKLTWALDVLLEDCYGVCDAFAEYLQRRHPKSAWNSFAVLLLERLKGFNNSTDTNNISHDYKRNQISDWTIHALEQSDRKDEIIPLCIAEARRTGSYERLVKRLIAARQYEDAEHWIQNGIQVTKKKWPGIASNLRNNLLKIRTLEKNWPAVVAIQVEEFVRNPSLQDYTDCRKTSERVKIWSKVRESLLHYLEKGELPWKQKDWPLPESGPDLPDADQHNRFPLIGDLIDIAILEKKPDHVLKWYDQHPKDPFSLYGLNEDAIATAVQEFAPDRAVAIWKRMAEKLIEQTKPKFYREAARFLRKASKVILQEKKLTEWESYLKELRQKHIRKIRLIEILDGLDGKPIVKKMH